MSERTRRATRPVHAWDRGVVGWDAAFWVVLALLAVSLVAEGDNPPEQLVTAFSVIGVLAVAYLLLGGPAARTRSQPRAFAYLAVLVVALVVLLWLDAGTSFLLFLAYPQVWLLVEGRARAVAMTAVVSVAGLVGFGLAFGFGPTALRSYGTAVAASFLFSLALGLWISSIIDQSAERADLVAQLRATRAELAAAERSAGAAEARARVARDIHDTLAQGFTSIVMLAQVARRDVDAGDADQARGRLAAMEDVARTNLAEARALVAAFSPVEVHGRDLVGALRRLGDRFAAETGVRVAVDVDETALDGLDTDLHQDLAVVLLRTAQEGLANVRKHAAATSVRLGLDRSGGTVRLVVEDDGRGLHPDVDGPTGFGLRGLRDRAGDVGGRVDVATAPGGGTRLAVEVPEP
ncbi:sensor histidine kinase [Aquipuribacter nitratireducens]|uniref:Oxygen sensor histidine kinase NreB n=1 Tax=Aquipuribacter nitratireducens TaxID=650104 RepID=A0ABW0GI96_9MICO